MEENRIYLKTGISIVIADLILKIIFYYIVPTHEFFYIFNSKSFIYTTTNSTLLGSQIVAMMEQSNTSINEVFFMSVVYFILGLYILLIRYTKLKKGLRILLGFVITILGILLFSFTKEFWSDIYIPQYAFNLVRSVGPLLALFAFFIISKDSFLKFILIGLLFGGISNTLNLFYPPFSVIDFLYIDILSNYFNTGIMNLADFIINICIFLMVIYVIIYLPIKRIKKNKIKTEHDSIPDQL